MMISDVSTAVLVNWIEQHGSIGKVDRAWAWWQNPDGSKGLAPDHGTRYLYRGQNRRYWSCVPAITRGIATRGRSLRELTFTEQMRFIAALIRTDWYAELLKSHPVFAWANMERYSIDRIALAQHYELPTGYIDLTESLEVALFFACCQREGTTWEPRTEGNGVLYRIDWVSAAQAVSSRIKAIGLQPFARPFAQWAWTIELMLDEDLEDAPGIEAVSFEHSAALGERLLAMFDGGTALLPPDPLYDWASIVKNSTLLPRSNALSVIDDLARDPLGIKATVPAELLPSIESAAGVRIVDEVPSPVTPATLNSITADWELKKPSFLANLKGRVYPVRTLRNDDATQTSSEPAR